MNLTWQNEIGKLILSGRKECFSLDRDSVQKSTARNSLNANNYLQFANRYGGRLPDSYHTVNLLPCVSLGAVV